MIGTTVIETVIAEFGREVTSKLLTGHGSKEDHLRGPFERMLAAIAGSLGLKITSIGETRLPDLSIRPDYAIDVAGARAGYVELKKPGHGVPDTWTKASKHDLEQWDKFQRLPNVLYTDGEQFARYHFGELQGVVARLEPGLDRAGSKLHTVGTDFARVLTDFLLWEPERPRTLDQLVRLIANLCGLLRDDVVAEIAREKSGKSKAQTFLGLAEDWRRVLFPTLSDIEFADQYAQTVTFALLLARVEGVSFPGRSIGEIARLLGKKHSFMGRALTVLTDQPEEEQSVALTTMVRVLSVVDWAEFPDDTYAMLYERFLGMYNPTLRRASGVYYTPSSLVAFMTRFVDDVLRSRLGRSLGFADKDVIVVDPAMGTGSFLAEVVNKVAATVADEEGPGAVPASLRELSKRLIGFENQAAPYAVAELRIHSLLKKRHRAEVPASERRFLADTLDDPDVQHLPLGRMYEVIERSRRGANQVKREEPVMVVIGNPPFVDKVKGTSPWIESASSLVAAPSLHAFKKPGNGRLEYVLSNKYIYFWRWATWKAFDAHPADPAGVVALVCPAGFATGPGFAGMREYLRRTADEGWFIDLTPEGHQPPISTRLIPVNQQPICVAIFIRRGTPNPDVPALIHRVSVSGSAQEKAAALDRLQVDATWATCVEDWAAPFRSVGDGRWNSMPALPDLMPWQSPGVKPNRTWVYAPDRSSLNQRWVTLVQADVGTKSALFCESRDANLRRLNPPLPGYPSLASPFIEERGAPPQLARVGFRSFDRQWILPDARLLATPRPPLWSAVGDRQVFVVEQHLHDIGTGPGLVFSSLIPDMHHFAGRGGRVLPLYRDPAGRNPNLSPGLLRLLANLLDLDVMPDDLVAYLAAVVAHPAFTRRFAADLKTPGIRIPLTCSSSLWTDAVQVGREVVWLHTYGERFADASAGRRAGPPKMRAGRPAVRVGIPDTEDGMPEHIAYDELTRTLNVGDGRISPVSPEAWNYKVAGMWVVKHWFGYRKKNPSGNRKSPLDHIIATTWTPAMTTELLELLNVLELCVALEPRQAALLDEIMAGPLLTVDDLTEAGILPVTAAAEAPPKSGAEPDLFSQQDPEGSD
ncbi:type ISP restriction/modification enzyme [Amycolatopsis sp. Hca4]|uniref:type ISP restriction/modification enzyme n=1 Tax=Amycolatopsis sp. Hca4 TaxID=2742131 RepID=UPI0015928025|nr:type ISP restriction/modification enzyme [Amycolatopsis sp. Hca4]QKV79532.1 N-6 DNA methylase [Amycolatopsis sp. Hca4]